MDWIANTPRTWPQPWRRAFVLLFPITVPLWLSGWGVVIAVTIAVGLLMFAFGILSLFPALMWATWKGKAVHDPADVVCDFWATIAGSVVSLFNRKS